MSDSDRKAELKRQFRRAQLEAARAAVPMPEPEARRFFELLDARLHAEGCDHTQRFAREIVERFTADEEELFDWLEQHGGYCDCEVMANVYPEWEHIHTSQL